MRRFARLSIVAIHVVATPRFAEPSLEASTCRGNVGRNQRDAEREHPEPEYRQEADDAAGHREQSEQGPNASRQSLLCPADRAIHDDHEAMAPMAPFASARLTGIRNGLRT
jgi:hypothetical protein